MGGWPDSRDQPKFGGAGLVADELTAGSALPFGQADERVPVVVVVGSSTKTERAFRTLGGSFVEGSAGASSSLLD